MEKPKPGDFPYGTSQNAVIKQLFLLQHYFTLNEIPIFRRS